MNAQDLYAIVSKVKRERWPMGMIWAPIATKFFIDEVDQAIPDDHAEMLFASAFRQSLHRDGWVVESYWEHQDGWTAVKISRASSGMELRSFCGKSEVAALAAAVTAMDGGEE